jgi:hypothetical protein
MSAGLFWGIVPAIGAALLRFCSLRCILSEWPAVS